MRRAAAVLLALVALAAAPAGAAACSFALTDPRARLAEADVALIGVVEARTVLDEPVALPQALLTVRVERAFRGAPGERVEVVTNADGASCGIEAGVGARLALLLQREADGRLHGWLDGQLTPAVLTEAAAPLPAPDGSGPPAVLLGARVGPNRLLVLDRRGRVLLYGAGDGRVTAAAGCPRGRFAVEVVMDRDGHGRLERRDLRTGAVSLVARLPRGVLESAVCRAPDASRVVVAGASGDGYARIVRVEDRRARLHVRLRGVSVRLGGPTAAVTQRDVTVLAVHVASGRREVVARVDPRSPSVDVARDGGIVVASGSQVDVRRPGRTGTYDLEGGPVAGVCWAGTRVVVGLPGHALVLGADGEPEGVIRRLPMPCRGGRDGAYAAPFASASLVVAHPGSGRVERRHLPGPALDVTTLAPLR